MAALPTVKIKADSEYGYAIINEADFDAAAHTLWSDAPAEPAEKPAKKAK